MKRIIQVLSAICLCSATAFFGVSAWLLWRVEPKLLVTIENADRTLIVVGAAATHVEIGARAWEQNSKNQVEITTQAMSRVRAAAEQLTIFVSQTNESINLKLLPTLVTAIQQQNASLLATQTELQANLSQMAQATIQFQQTLLEANKVLSDPKIPVLLADADANLKQMNLMLKSGTATAEDVQKVADKFSEQYTKARNIWLAGASWLLQKAWELRGAVGF